MFSLFVLFWFQLRSEAAHALPAVVQIASKLIETGLKSSVFLYSLRKTVGKVSPTLVTLTSRSDSDFERSNVSLKENKPDGANPNPDDIDYYVRNRWFSADCIWGYGLVYLCNKVSDNWFRKLFVRLTYTLWCYGLINYKSVNYLWTMHEQFLLCFKRCFIYCSSKKRHNQSR